MYISFDIPKAHSVTRDDTYKDPQKPFIDFPDPSYADLGQAKCQGLAICILKSRRSHFKAQN